MPHSKRQLLYDPRELGVGALLPPSGQRIGPISHISAGADRQLGRLRTAYERSYACRNSSREMPAWVQIVRKVEALMCEWFGMVKGVRVPSGLSRTMEMCSR